MHERERSRDSASTISGKRCVRSFPGRLHRLTRLSSLRAMTLMPSCFISSHHWSPEGHLVLLSEDRDGQSQAGLVRRDNDVRGAVAGCASTANEAG